MPGAGHRVVTKLEPPCRVKLLTNKAEVNEDASPKLTRRRPVRSILAEVIGIKSSKLSNKRAAGLADEMAPPALDSNGLRSSRE
jgi:hypothetical protein